MIGEQSYLHLPDLDLADYRLTFAASPYIPGGDPRPQRLTMVVNDTVVLPVLEVREHIKRAVAIPATALRPRGNVVTFLHPDGRVPVDSADKRVLSFAMFWLTLERPEGSNAGRPIGLICGSEHAFTLFQIADNFQELKQSFEFRYLSRNVTEAQLADRLPAEYADRVGFIWMEAASARQFLPRIQPRVPSAVQLVRFPVPHVSSLWPTRGNDPRSKPEPLYPGGRYPAIDSVAAALAGSDLPDDALYAKYLANAAKVGVSAERRYDLDRVRWRLADRDADVSLAPFIERRFHDERMFVAPNHAAALLLAKMFEACLAGAHPQIDDLGTICAASHQMLHGYLGPFNMQWPISPPVAQALGLTWYSDTFKFRFGNNLLTFREFLLRYIRWSHYIA